MTAAGHGKQVFRVGLLGAGHISEFHARALGRLSNVALVGVADLDRDRAQRLAQRHRIADHFGSLRELLAARPDVVHILTPPASHAQNAIEALDRGCHVLVEKPLATSVEDCDRIASAAETAGRTVGVDHSLLLDPFVVKALNLVRSGAIGEVVGFDHFRSQWYPPYPGGPMPETYRDGGFPFRDIGVHSIYLAEAFLGPIRAATLRLGSPENDGCPRFKEWRVLLETDRGPGQIYLSWNVQPLQNVLFVHGTRGVLRADIFGMSVTARRKGRLPGHAERIANMLGEGARTILQVSGNVLRVLTGRLRQYHGLQSLVAEFYQALADGRQPLVGLDQGRRAVQWTEHIARQADEAKRSFESRFATRGNAKVLLTGATGFIGRHLLRRLVQEKEKVRILVRRSPQAEVLGCAKVEAFLGDLGDPDAVDRALDGIEEVFHLGATVHGYREDFQRGTIEATRNIIESCLRHRVSKLVYMSSLSVIHAAAATPDVKITEDWPLEPCPERRGLYTQTKLAAERMVAEAVRTRGLRAVILRPGEVLGPDRAFLSGAVGIETARRVIVFGKGRSAVPLIWIDDLVDAIMAASRCDGLDGRVFNLVDPEEITQQELAEHYLRATNRRKKIVHFPLPVLLLAAAGLEIAFRLVGRNAPISPYRLRSAIGTRRFDCTAARDSLRWCPKVGVRSPMREKLVRPST